MIILESHTATCKDCWARGDKRVSEEWDNIEQSERAQITLAEECESNTDRGCLISDDEGGYPQAEDFLCSRPSTPQLYYEIHSSLCPVAEDNNFELTRVCDPVHPASMGRDYRARRCENTSSQYYSDSEWDEVDSFVSCEEYFEEGTSEETPDSGNDDGDNFYHIIVGDYVGPESPTQNLEDQSLLLYGRVQKY